MNTSKHLLWRHTAAILLLAASLSTAREAHGAACCMSATASGIGRLLIWERFAVGLRSSIVGGVGTWDAGGRWHSYDQTYRDIEWRNDVWAIVGLGRRWSLYGRLPWVLSYRRAGNLGDSVGGGLADVQAGARFEVFGIGEYLWVPALALTAMISFPTGRAIEASNAGGSGITSRGAWSLSFGATIEKTVLPWFVQFALAVSIPLPKQREDVGMSQRYGIGLQPALTGGVELLRGLVLSLTARYLWEDEITLGGARIEGSSRSDTGLSLALSWRFDPHWTLQTALDSGAFTDGLGDNTAGRLIGTVGVRYGYF